MQLRELHWMEGGQDELMGMKRASRRKGSDLSVQDPKFFSEQRQLEQAKKWNGIRICFVKNIDRVVKDQGNEANYSSLISQHLIRSRHKTNLCRSKMDHSYQAF